MNEQLELVQQWLQRERGNIMGSQGSVLGVDVGSYGLRAILADLQGQQVVAEQTALPSGDPDAVVEAALGLAHSVLKQAGKAAQHMLRIGIGFGGPVDGDAGVTRLSHRTPGWERYPLCQRFEDVFDAPALLDNDANVIALAEAACGVGRDVRNLFYLHLSTGVGGGMVFDRRLYHGATSTAGEVGHAIVRYDGPPCSCGAHGHLESYVSIGGLLRRANELGLRTDDLETLFSDGAAGQQAIDEATELLGYTLANIVSLFDPNMIVVGGIVARKGGERFMQAVHDRLESALPPTMRREVPIVPSTFGNDSVAVGALALAVQSLHE